MSEEKEPTQSELAACEKRAVDLYYAPNALGAATSREKLVKEFGEACVARMLEIGIGNNKLPDCRSPRPFLTDPEAINDAVDAWQETGPEAGPLYAWLGWSHEQYAKWVETSVPPEAQVGYYASKLGNDADQWAVADEATGATHAVTYADPGGHKAHLFAAAQAMRDAIGELLEDPYLADPINRDRMARARAAFDNSKP